MNAFDIMDQVHQSGGTTVCLNGSYVPFTGYLVAFGGQFGKALPKKQATALALANFIKKHYGQLVRGSGVYLGVWKDGETGKVWFDLVECVRSEKEAVELGKQRKQIAVWNIAQAKEVRC